jgi:hypothetical protein
MPCRRRPHAPTERRSTRRATSAPPTRRRPRGSPTCRQNWIPNGPYHCGRPARRLVDGPWRMPSPSMISGSAGRRCSMAARGARLIVRADLRGDRDHPSDRWNRMRSPCDIWGMNDHYEVQLIEQPAGRWIYRLVVVGADDLSTWESDAESYLTREDAERAGRLAVAAKLLRDRG